MVIQALIINPKDIGLTCERQADHIYYGAFGFLLGRKRRSEARFERKIVDELISLGRRKGGGSLTEVHLHFNVLSKQEINSAL